MSLLSTLHICKLIISFPTTSTDQSVINAWHAVFDSIFSTIARIRASTAETQTDKNGRVAYEILQLIDEDDKLGLEDLSSSDASVKSQATTASANTDTTSPNNPVMGDATQMNDPDYNLWAANFDVKQAQCPDKMVRLLAQIAREAGEPVDDNGRNFWRVRLLMEKKQV